MALILALLLKLFSIYSKKNLYYFLCNYVSNFSEPFVLEDSSQFFLPEHPGEPQFAEGVDKNANATGQLGGTVFLHCPVVNSGDRAVSYPSVSTTVII